MSNLHTCNAYPTIQEDMQADCNWPFLTEGLRITLFRLLQVKILSLFHLASPPQIPNLNHL